MVFDVAMGSLILIFAFTQGVFPKPPDFADLDAFDLSFFAQNPSFTLFLITALAIAVLVAFALLSARVRAFWERVRQGLTILRDRRRYFREVCRVQLGGLAAFASPPSGSCSRRSTSAARSRTCCSCSASTRCRRWCRFTPQGAGVQQALLAKVFADSAAGATVAAYSVGQQVAIGLSPSASASPRWRSSSACAASRRSSGAGARSARPRPMPAAARLGPAGTSRPARRRSPRAPRARG